MSRKSFWVFIIGAVVMVALATSDVCAQGRGGRGGRGRGFGGPRPGGGFNLMGLLGVEEVRAEIELTPEQQDLIRKAADQARENRPRGERPNFQDMSPQEREQFFAEMRERAEKRAADDKKTLAEILVPPQLERLEQIALQMQGVGALANAEVAKKIGLDEAQAKTIQTELQNAMASMRETFAGGNREGRREKIESLRKELNEQVLAKLTDEQRKEFEELKGEPFKMPEGMLRPRGGRGGPGGQGGGGRRGGNRPQRPSGDAT